MKLTKESEDYSLKRMFKEVIIVEGRDDTRRLREVYGTIDTFETGGSALDAAKLAQIRQLQQSRGVIIFTDPDYPGQKIRQEISQEIPECKHAYLKKEEARPKSGKGLGVEHASADVIRDALQNAMTPAKNQTEHISQAFLLKHDLVAHPLSKAKRETLAERLGIGYVNGKQLRHRLNMFGITEEQVIAVLEK